MESFYDPHIGRLVGTHTRENANHPKNQIWTKFIEGGLFDGVLSGQHHGFEYRILYVHEGSNLHVLGISLVKETSNEHLMLIRLDRVKLVIGGYGNNVRPKQIKIFEVVRGGHPPTRSPLPTPDVCSCRIKTEVMTSCHNKETLLSQSNNRTIVVGVPNSHSTDCFVQVMLSFDSSFD